MSMSEASDDALVRALTLANVDEIRSWFKVRGRVDDFPLELRKSVRVTLSPVRAEVDLKFPHPRGWPRELQDRVMKQVMAGIEASLREKLFG